jgi:hypothetical protein
MRDWKKRKALVAYCLLLRMRIPGFGPPLPRQLPEAGVPVGLYLSVLVLRAHSLAAAAETAAEKTRVLEAAVQAVVVVVVPALTEVFPAMALEAVVAAVVAAAAATSEVEAPASTVLVRRTRMMIVVSYLVPSPHLAAPTIQLDRRREVQI